MMPLDSTMALLATAQVNIETTHDPAPDNLFPELRLGGVIIRLATGRLVTMRPSSKESSAISL